MRGKFLSTLKVGLALFVAVFSNGLVPSVAQAYSTTNPDNQFKKVYVCKYVGTPGVDERLQTGDNPIDVDTHALGSSFTGLGSFFNDAQGRSVAIAWDNKDKIEPAVGMCPAPQGPVDECPNLVGNQAVVPAGMLKDESGNCVTDVCPNLEGIQLTVPDGKYKDTQGNCVPIIVDECPNIPEVQLAAPVGMMKDEQGNCVTDVCPNVEGIQLTVPAGMHKNEQGNCVPVVIVVDVCPNIEGSQLFVPVGMYKDLQGDCVSVVIDECPNLPGSQVGLPAGMVKDEQGNCIENCNCNCENTCPPTQIEVTPLEPDFNDICGTRNDNFIIPITHGVVYKMKGSVLAAGPHNGATGTVTIAAEDANPDDSFVINPEATTEWTHNFTDEECPQVPPTDVCPNIPGNQTVIPIGMTKDQNRNCVTPGGGGGGVLGDTDVCPNIEGSQATVPSGLIKDTAGSCVSVPPTPAGGRGGGQILGEAATTTLPATLPATGGVSFLTQWLPIIAAAFAYGVSSLIQRKQRA